MVRVLKKWCKIQNKYQMNTNKLWTYCNCKMSTTEVNFRVGFLRQWVGRGQHTKFVSVLILISNIINSIIRGLKTSRLIFLSYVSRWLEEYWTKTIRGMSIHFLIKTANFQWAWMLALRLYHFDFFSRLANLRWSTRNVSNFYYPMKEKLSCHHDAIGCLATLTRKLRDSCLGDRKSPSTGPCFQPCLPDFLVVS